MTDSEKDITDYDLLQQAFGEEYFIFCQLEDKRVLSNEQEQNLQELISERNHFEILNLLGGLRKQEKFKRA